MGELFLSLPLFAKNEPVSPPRLHSLQRLFLGLTRQSPILPLNGSGWAVAALSSRPISSV